MSRAGYLWKLVRESFHGTLRMLEIGEAFVAIGVHVLSGWFPAHKEEFELAFQMLLGILILTFFVGIFLAAYASNREMEDVVRSKSDEIVQLNNQILSQRNNDEKFSEMMGQVVALRERCQFLESENQRLGQAINDAPLSLADVKNMFRALASKAKDLNPQKLADCGGWIADAKELISRCLGEQRCPKIAYPPDVTDTANRARQLLKEWADWLNTNAISLRQDDLIGTCTQSRLAQFRDEVGRP